MTRRRAALFDMDRTLVRVETASLWMRYQRDIGEATLRDALRVTVWVLQYTLGVIDAPKVARLALASLRGTSEEQLKARCVEFVAGYVAHHITEAAKEAVRWHQERGDHLAIVTGASPYAAWPVARMLEIPHVVASELEVRDGLLTGQAEDPLCYGVGKVVRALRLAETLDFDLQDAIFYTDSHTDLPLLEAVREPVVVNPDFRLKRIAKQRGWRVERW